MFGGGEDFQVVESVAASAAEERALDVAEGFFGGFGAVLVDVVDPAFGHCGDEVGVGFRGGGGEGVFHPGEGVRVGEVLGFVQGGADDRRGPGRDLGGGRASASTSTTGRDFLPGYSGLGQDLGREGEPAPCFADPDPQPGPEELRRVPVPIIQRAHC